MRALTIPLPRRGRPIRALAGLLLLLLVAGCTRTTTVMLIRHAEREEITPTNPDPPLLPAGQARAAQLVAVARDAGVSEIIVSDTVRTQQTAAPLAAELGLTPVVMPVGASAQAHAQAVADRLSSRIGRTLLVVGHSNTVPLIIQALGFTPPPTIGDGDFGLMFVVLKRERGATRLVRVRYGS